MHASRHVIALLLIALSAVGLAACDKLTSTTIVRTLQDDARDDRSWAKTWKDRAEFRCLASTSGNCLVVVFVRDCPGAGCATRVLKEFALPAGTSRTVTDLPRGFKHCVAHDAKPVAPTCLKPEVQ